MGRPKGSKNKPKPAVAPAASITPQAAPAVQKRARATAAPPPPPPTPPPVTNEVPKRRGRPPGSKNKPKNDAPVTPAAPATPATPATPAAEPAKRTARVVVPTVTPPPLPPAVTTTPPATQITRTETDDSSDQPSAAEKLAAYTALDLRHPALKELEAHAVAFFDKASPRQKVFFEGKVRPGMTTPLAVLKVLVDFFEIDVLKLIDEHAKAKTAHEKVGG